MSTNTKARRDAILEAAKALLERRGGDVLERVSIRELAPELAAAVECHPDTARRHIVRAAQQMGLIKPPDEPPGEWGGERENSGWTKGAPRMRGQRRAALLLQHSHTRAMWRLRAGTYGSGPILKEWGALDMPKERAIDEAKAWGEEEGYIVVINEAWI